MFNNAALALALSGFRPAEPESFIGNDYSMLGADDEYSLNADQIELLGSDASNIAELLGAEAIELLGAEARRRRAVRNNRVVARPAPQLGRELFLPVPSTGVVAAGANVIVNVQPQLTCQINQLVIPSTQGPNWVVNDVTIGTRSQFAAPGAISAVALSEVQTGKLKGDTASLGTIISVSLTNITAGNATLLGAFFRVYAIVS